MSFESPLPPYGASDPSASFLALSTLDFLLIELVPMAYRLAREVDLKKDDELAGYTEEQLQAKEQEKREKKGNAGSVSTRQGTMAGGVSGTGKEDGDEEERDAVFWRLESLGYRVGLGIVERFSTNRPHFTDPLDAIKFLCKDLWSLLFRKQIDNLKTNHRGVYVLTDSAFRPFARISGSPRDTPQNNAVVRAQPYLWFPCGVVRGCLAGMGIEAQVQAESAELPGATFQIKSIPPKQLA